MPIQPDGQAPYAPPQAVLTVIRGYRDKGLVTPFDLSVLERAGVPPTLTHRTLQSLKLLGLVDSEGNPTAGFEELAKAGTKEYPQRLAAIVRDTYQEVFQFTEPRDDTPEKVRDAFRVYKPRGQQERMVTLFLKLCEEAGLIDKGQRKPRPAKAAVKATRVRTGKTAKRKPDTEESPSDPATDFTASPPPQTGQHPFIRGLLQSLPEAGETWSLAKRQAWTKAALAAFDLMYELPPDEAGGESD